MKVTRLPRHYTPTLPVWAPVRGVMGCLRQQIYLWKSGSAAVTRAQTATEILLPYGRGAPPTPPTAPSPNLPNILLGKDEVSEQKW